MAILLLMTVSTATANEANLKANISAGTSLQSGNSNNENYNAAHALKVFNNQYGYSHSVKAFYGESGSEIYRNYFSLSNTLDYTLSNRWEFFLFQYSERDTVANLEYSIYAGAGIKYRFLNEKSWKVDFSAAPVYRVQHYTGNETGKQPAISNRFRLFYTPAKNLQFKNIFFYVPAFHGNNSSLYTGDYASISSSLLAGLAETGKTKLGLEIKYLLRYQQSPPGGVKNKDHSLTAALNIAYDSGI